MEILPQNIKTTEIMRKRAEEHEQARIRAEEMRQVREREEKQRRNKEKLAEADKAKREKALREAEAKRRQEESSMNEIDATLMEVFAKMESNTTPFEVSLQGIKLQTPQVGILCKQLGVNKSLLALDLCRMGIDDDNGKVIATYLRRNTHLRKLELEGNLLGPKTAMEFGKTLKVNTSLKVLNLDSNQLAAEGGAD